MYLRSRVGSGLRHQALRVALLPRRSRAQFGECRALETCGRSKWLVCVPSMTYCASNRVCAKRHSKITCIGKGCLRKGCLRVRELLTCFLSFGNQGLSERNGSVHMVSGLSHQPQRLKLHPAGLVSIKKACPALGQHALRSRP